MSDVIVERRAVNIDTFHKCITTLVSAGVILWGCMVYYITAEDKKNMLIIESRLNRLEDSQKENVKVHRLVYGIDTRLARMEQILIQQNEVLTEVKELRGEINRLKITINNLES